MLKIENYTPKLLIESLKSIKNLKDIYSVQIRHYTLESHTLLVLSEFEKYFDKDEEIMPLDKNLFRLLLALHDIGKSYAHLQGNRNNQYYYTQKIITEIQQELSLTKIELNILLNLLSGDILGQYFQNKLTLEKTLLALKDSSAKAEISIKDYFRILLIYYQCDIASYTLDAGGLSYLEKFFEYKNGTKIFDPDKKMLKFTSGYNKMFNKLETELMK